MISYILNIRIRRIHNAGPQYIYILNKQNYYIYVPNTFSKPCLSTTRPKLMEKYNVSGELYLFSFNIVSFTESPVSPMVITSDTGR